MNTRIPLFPLHLVLFPSAPLPLHVFEERYRLMIERCIEETLPFGVVYHKGESMCEVGCSAVIDQVVRRYDDGRIDIVSVGRDRFSIEDVDDTGLYMEADVRLIDESSPPSNQAMITRAADEILRYAFFQELRLERESLEALTVNQLSYLIAGFDALGLDAKQELLEINSPTERLSIALAALAETNAQLVQLARLKQVLGHDVNMSDLMN